MLVLIRKHLLDKLLKHMQNKMIHFRLEQTNHSDTDSKMKIITFIGGIFMEDHIPEMLDRNISFKK